MKQKQIDQVRAFAILFSGCVTTAVYGFDFEAPQLDVFRVIPNSFVVRQDPGAAGAGINAGDQVAITERALRDSTSPRLPATAGFGSSCSPRTAASQNRRGRPA